jgi:hypothetical protein
MKLNHTPQPCSDCNISLPMSELASHRLKQCPDRLIICRFCHLRVKAGPLSKLGKDLLLGGGITEHESECGSRTIGCVKCGQNVQLKDVQIHAQVNDPNILCFTVCGLLTRPLSSK